MMIFSLVAMIGLEKCCITSACLQWLCHSGERTGARGPLVFFVFFVFVFFAALSRGTLSNFCKAIRWVGGWGLRGTDTLQGIQHSIRRLQ